jgi:hypothetical protein
MIIATAPDEAVHRSAWLRWHSVTQTITLSGIFVRASVPICRLF